MKEDKQMDYCRAASVSVPYFAPGPFSAVVVFGLVLGCQAPSVPLELPWDAGAAVDAGWARDDAGPDGGVPHVANDSGPRLFTARLGRVYGPGPEAFVPADLSGYTVTARSALGPSTPTIDGPGQFTVWAQGRLELTVMPASRFDERYVVSTEASHVDLTWAGRPPPDAPPVDRFRLDLELSSPWTSSDRLRVSSSGYWPVKRVSQGFGEGETVASIEVEGFNDGHVVDEDLWVVRERVEHTESGTVTWRLDQGIVSRVSRDILSRPLMLRLTAPAGGQSSFGWDLTEWRADGLSTPWQTSAGQVFVRADCIDNFVLGGICNGAGKVADVMVYTKGLSGSLVNGGESVPGYLVCSGATRHSDGPSAAGVESVRLLRSEVCSCGSSGTPVRLTLGPIRDLRLDGQALGSSPRPYRPPISLSWRPPEIGSANGYVVQLDYASASLYLVTDDTRVTVPAGIIPEGVIVVPSVTAIEDFDRPPVESPFIRSRRFQKTDWAGGLLVPKP